jgi:hypothetical protein
MRESAERMADRIFAHKDVELLCKLALAAELWSRPNPDPSRTHPGELALCKVLTKLRAAGVLR